MVVYRLRCSCEFTDKRFNKNTKFTVCTEIEKSAALGSMLSAEFIRKMWASEELGRFTNDDKARWVPKRILRPVLSS